MRTDFIQQRDPGDENERKDVRQMKVSVIIPVYNEEKTVGKVIKFVEGYINDKDEIIVVNDGSTDETKKRVLDVIVARSRTILVGSPINKGKGAAIREGLEYVTGDIVIIQDADMEYSPLEYDKLFEPIIDGHADVVYGSRFRGSSPKRVMYFKNYLANKFLTFMSNLFTGLNLSDMETGFKAFRADILKGIDLKENGFGFEPEVTAKVKKHRIYEVGISYYGRTYAEGKKIRPRDGFRALYCILKYNLWKI